MIILMQIYNSLNARFSLQNICIYPTIKVNKTTFKNKYTHLLYVFYPTTHSYSG